MIQQVGKGGMDGIVCDHMIIIQDKRNGLDISKLVNDLGNDRLWIPLPRRNLELCPRDLKRADTAMQEADRVVIIRIQ